ncbi:MAG: hypothetical protein KBD78_04495 [Oligoflexales bacterium]|nr:hypothetical protein [Oligoflexales bacterium]
MQDSAYLKYILILYIVFATHLYAQIANKDSIAQDGETNFFRKNLPNTLVYLPLNRSSLYNRLERDGDVTLVKKDSTSTISNLTLAWSLDKTYSEEWEKKYSLNFINDFGLRTYYFKYKGLVVDRNIENYSYDYSIESTNIFMNYHFGLSGATPYGTLKVRFGMGPVFGAIKDSFYDQALFMSAMTFYSIGYYIFFNKTNLAVISVGSNAIWGRPISNAAMDLGGWANISFGFGWGLY